MAEGLQPCLPVCVKDICCHHALASAEDLHERAQGQCV